MPTALRHPAAMGATPVELEEVRIMGWVTALAIYFVIWWTVLFAILPIGMRSQIEDDDVILGTAHSAPTTFSFSRKAFWTTCVSLLVFAAFYLVTEVWGIGPDTLPHIIPGT